MDFYNLKMQTLYDEEGQELLRFDFTWSKDLLPMDYNRRNITGTAYVDAETCRLLRFDGSCNNCTVRMGIMSSPISIDFHLEYDYSQDVASVSNIAIQGSNDFMSYRVLLFAIEENKQELRWDLENIQELLLLNFQLLFSQLLLQNLLLKKSILK